MYAGHSLMKAVARQNLVQHLLQLIPLPSIAKLVKIFHDRFRLRGLWQRCENRDHRIPPGDDPPAYSEFAVLSQELTYFYMKILIFLYPCKFTV